MCPYNEFLCSLCVCDDRQYEPTPAQFTDSDYTEDQDDMEMGAAVIAYRTFSWTHPDITALQVRDVQRAFCCE